MLRRTEGCMSVGSVSSHKLIARSAWAVMSGVLRSKGRRPHPLQKVGIPPSLFWSDMSQRMPWPTSGTYRPWSRVWRATSAPEVSSPSGTDPERSVHPHPPAGAPVNGWRLVVAWLRKRSAIRSLSVKSFRNARIASEVTHAARLVSIGHEPSARRVDARNWAHAWVTGCWVMPDSARHMLTKAVSGAASRNPPSVGCNFVSKRMAFPSKHLRSGVNRVRRFWFWRIPTAIRAGMA